MKNRDSFLLGMIFAFNFYGLFTDLQYIILGRENYFQYYQNEFILPIKTMPLHIAVLITVIIYYIKRVK
ncbi:MAG: hypothetical protein ACRCX2_33220 [Paraclostridium sp.]